MFCTCNCKREFRKKIKKKLKIWGFLHNTKQAFSMFTFFPLYMLRGSSSSLFLREFWTAQEALLGFWNLDTVGYIYHSNMTVVGAGGLISTLCILGGISSKHLFWFTLMGMKSSLCAPKSMCCKLKHGKWGH